MDWTQARRITMGMIGGFLIGGIVIPLMNPSQTRTVYEQVETVKTVTVDKIVEKEVIVWKEKTKIVREKSQQASKIWEFKRNGDVRLTERTSLIEKDSKIEAMVTEQQKEKEALKTVSTEATSKIAVTMEQATKPSLGLGIQWKVGFPVVPRIEDFSLNGYASIGNSNLWLSSSYSYPLNFGLGVVYVW